MITKPDAPNSEGEDERSIGVVCRGVVQETSRFCARRNSKDRVEYMISKHKAQMAVCVCSPTAQSCSVFF
jgi:hypothetical protein